MSKKVFWISFDLGIKGDYDSLFTWLDKLEALECGSHMAAVVYEYTGEFLEVLKKDIEENVETNRRTRIYIAFKDESTKKLRGRFLFGNRKSPKWAGYYRDPNQDEIEL